MLKHSVGKKNSGMIGARLLTVGVVVSSLLLCGCKTDGNVKAPASGSKEYFREQGIAYMGQERYSDAIVAFEAALKKSNGIVRDIDYDISYYLALAEYKAGNHEEAYNIYSAIIGMDEKAADAYYLRGRVTLYEGDRQAAMSDYDKAVELKKTDHNLYKRIYLDLASAGYEEDGRAYVNRALQSDQKISDYHRGVYSYYLEKYDDARNYLEKARNKNTDADLIAYLGKTYKKLGDNGYAASLFETYLGTDPTDAEIYNELGLVKLESGDLDGALTAFQNGIATGDEAVMQSLLFNEIVTYEYKLDFESAKNKMAEYVIRYPNDEKAKRENIFLSTR
ncbi:MAG: tetratricopeptide repeat protein [Lachnospiraceae bacterium]|nr:tetratricopeptide repeat protein [Lachnospiraceae bacterium]